MGHSCRRTGHGSWSGSEPPRRGGRDHHTFPLIPHLSAQLGAHDEVEVPEKRDYFGVHLGYTEKRRLLPLCLNRSHSWCQPERKRDLLAALAL